MKLAELRFADDDDTTLIARLDGEVDLSNARDIGAAIRSAMSNRPLALVLDLTVVRYIDSTGVELIYQLRESLRARGQKLLLVIPTASPVHASLRLAGAAGHVDTYETLDEALGRVER